MHVPSVSKSGVEALRAAPKGVGHALQCMRNHSQRDQCRPAGLPSIGRDDATEGSINEVGATLARGILNQVQNIFYGTR